MKIEIQSIGIQCIYYGELSIVLKDNCFRREAAREQLFSKDLRFDGSCVINATSEEKSLFFLFWTLAPRLNEVLECS
jgi:hypothetical protein